MSILVVPLPPQACEVRPCWESDATAIAQGPEGREVRKQIEALGRHWREQTLDPIRDDASSSIDELERYRHVPFERAGTRRVRYVRVSELKPRSIAFEEDDA